LINQSISSKVINLFEDGLGNGRWVGEVGLGKIGERMGKMG
jgi:hypothetical protein